MATTTLVAELDDAQRPYPRLTEAQKVRVLTELLQEYRLNNLRPVRTVEAKAYEVEEAHETRGKR
jgi:hypothetical protein